MYFSRAETRRWAHPRSRGEHWAQQGANDAPPGSSPLARGTQSLDRALNNIRGLIPARAGNTMTDARRSHLMQAHPRSRGEHASVGHTGGVITGSSPLARGTPAEKRGEDYSPGLIPARAGNTAVRCCRAHAPKAHPRSRGEHAFDFSSVSTSAGSSPLARGTRGHAHQPVADQGLIPARAGNTARGYGTTPPAGAHPRSRGEHVSS